MHSPCLFNDQLLFVSEDDLWSTDLNATNPRRLTHGLGIIRNPQFSPDGKHIAFSATSEGAEEIYLMATNGANAKRLTYLGHQAKLCIWLDNNTLIFSSHHACAFRQNKLYRLDIHSANIALLPYGPANHISVADEMTVIQRHGYGYTSFKRYQGGLAGELWLQKNAQSFQPLIAKKHNTIAPIIYNKRVYFLADHQDHGNIYSCDPQGHDLQRHTHHEDFYVSSFHIHNDTIVYAKGGKIFHTQLNTQHTEQVPIKHTGVHNPQYERQFASNNQRLESALLSKNGEYITISNRGRLFHMPTWQGGAYHLADLPKLRFKSIAYAHDDQLLVSCDEGKQDSLYLFKQELPHSFEVINHKDFGRILGMQTSPDGLYALINNHKHELLLLDIKKKTITLLAHSHYNPISDYDWSPDSQYLVYSVANTHETAMLKLYNINSAVHTELTPGAYLDYEPHFDPKGKYIYFLSQRHYQAQMDELLFQYGYSNSCKVYLINLDKESPSPFLHTPTATKTKDTSKEKEDNEDEDECKITPTKIDLPDIAMRVCVFPIAAGKYTQILALNDKLLLLNNTHQEEDDECTDGSLCMYNFKEQSFDTLVEGISSASLSQDRKSLLYYYEHKLRVIDAGSKPDSNDLSYKNGGWIDIKRARITINPEQEWPFIFTEAWRLQRDFYWDKDMGGIDWDAVFDKYYPLVQTVRSRSELNDVIAEMQGELGTSHAYTWGGEIPKTKSYPLGHLGCDTFFDPKKKQHIVSAIWHGEASDSIYQSPLRGPGIGVQVGDAILAINGQLCDENNPPEKRLIHQANRYVILSIQPKDPKQPIHFKHIKTLGNIKPLLYRQWVEHNKAYVEKHSQGKYGYVHIPDMSKFGLTEFYRNYHQCYDKEGIVVDVRFNGGGHVSSMILQKLAVARFGLDFTRWHGASFSYPYASPRGNMVALCNENTGSDGDIFSYAFKKLKLGKLFGKRTWGGVVGINVRNQLLDGGVTTQPEYAVWFQDSGYSIENHGVDPDTIVEISPEQAASGHDPQLNAAIAHLNSLQPPTLEQKVKQHQKPSRKARKLPKD